MKIHEALTNIDNKLISEAEAFKPKKHPYVKWVAIAACFCLVASAIAFAFPKEESLPQEPAWKSATVTEGADGYEPKSDKYLLVYYSEEEMFAMEDMLIFRGTVKSLQNYTIDFNGYKEYRCVATVEVSRMYKGEEKQEFRILLPCAISEEGPYMEDTGIIRQIKVGMEGIFMARQASETESYMEMNGARFCYTELAECSIGDGMRWVFLQDGERLMYLSPAYPSAGAKTLDDAERYVLNMLN